MRVTEAGIRRPWLNRSSTPILVGLILVALAVLALIGDLRLRHGRMSFPYLHTFTFRRNPLTSALLLYAEESGVPLPAPGDVFVIYAGIAAPKSILGLTLVGILMVLAVVGGASNLFLIARRYGSRLAHGRVGVALHLTPKRLEQAERWFQRWGPLALIFGRHIPGLRIPITVAAAVFNVSWRLFAACVAVSSAIWVVVFMTLGIVYGRAALHLLDRHRALYILLPALLAIFWIGLIGYRFWSHRSHGQAKP